MEESKNLENVPLADYTTAGVSETATARVGSEKPGGKHRKGLIIGIVAALVVAIAAVAVFLIINANRPEKLLTQGWELTGQLLAERAAGGPMAAVGKALSQEAESAKLTISLSDFVLPDAPVDGNLEMELYTSKEPRMLMTAASSFGGYNFDTQFYYDKAFVGFGSKALFGSETIYGGTPGSLAAEAKGSAFDPYTGEFAMDADTLRQMDEMLGSIGKVPADTEDLEAATADVVALYTEFLQSAVPKTRKDKLPTTGEEATVIAYVYPTEKVTGMLRSICDSYLKDPAVVTYFNTLEATSGYTGIYDITELRNTWTVLLDELERNGSAEVNVQYYLVDKTVAYMTVDAKPIYEDAPLILSAVIDFGINTGELNATLNLGRYVILRLNSKQFSSDGISKSDWTLEVIAGSNDDVSVSGMHRWDSKSGEIQFSLAVDVDYVEMLALDANGTLKIDDTLKIDLMLDELSLAADYDMTSTFRMGLTWEPGVETPLPQETQNMFNLSESKASELFDTLLNNLVDLLYS